MELAVTILVIVLALMFISGIVVSVLTFRFNKQKRYPVVTIILSVLVCPLLYVPLSCIIGFMTARLALLLILPYSIAMIVRAVKNLRDNKNV